MNPQLAISACHIRKKRLFVRIRLVLKIFEDEDRKIPFWIEVGQMLSYNNIEMPPQIIADETV